VGGCIEPAPISPNPPALLTAAASRQPLHQTIPACTMGSLILNRADILLLEVIFEKFWTNLMAISLKICDLDFKVNFSCANVVNLVVHKEVIDL
jgi:hypothetical protein